MLAEMISKKEGLYKNEEKSITVYIGIAQIIGMKQY